MAAQPGAMSVETATVATHPIVLFQIGCGIHPPSSPCSKLQSMPCSVFHVHMIQPEACSKTHVCVSNDLRMKA